MREDCSKYPSLHKCACGKEAQYQIEGSRVYIHCSDSSCPIGYSVGIKDMFQRPYKECAEIWNKQMESPRKVIDETILTLKSENERCRYEINCIKSWSSSNRLGAYYMGPGIETVFRLTSRDCDSIVKSREESIIENEERIHKLVLLSIGD